MPSRAAAALKGGEQLGGSFNPPRVAHQNPPGLSMTGSGLEHEQSAPWVLCSFSIARRRLLAGNKGIGSARKRDMHSATFTFGTAGLAVAKTEGAGARSKFAALATWIGISMMLPGYDHLARHPE